MKFIMIFIIVLISLLMIIFGGLFMTCANNEIYNNIKDKVDYEFRTPIQQAIIDDCIKKFPTIGLIMLIVGLCLLIASLFL